MQDDVSEDNINYSITNKEDKEDNGNDDVNDDILISDDLDEKYVESDKGDIDEEQQIDDIFVNDNKDQQDETIFANAINMDKEEMNEDSLLKLLEEYELEKIKMVVFLWNWKLELNCCHCSGNQMQASSCMGRLCHGLSNFSLK